MQRVETIPDDYIGIEKVRISARLVDKPFANNTVGRAKILHRDLAYLQEGFNALARQAAVLMNVKFNQRASCTLAEFNPMVFVPKNNEAAQAAWQQVSDDGVFFSTQGYETRFYVTRGIPDFEARQGYPRFLHRDGLRKPEKGRGYCAYTESPMVIAQDPDVEKVNQKTGILKEGGLLYSFNLHDLSVHSEDLWHRAVFSEDVDAVPRFTMMAS